MKIPPTQLKDMNKHFTKENKHVEGAQHCPLSRKCNWKQQWAITALTVEWLNFKNELKNKCFGSVE